MITNHGNITMDFSFESVIEFYSYCSSVKETGNLPKYEDILKTDREDFRGASLEEIKKRKYQYREGLIRMKELKKELFDIGKKSFKRIWSEEDGDEMDYERFIDDKPFLERTINVNKAKKRGKFISIYIDVTVAWFVDSDDLIWKCISAGKIIESLELQGYRTEVVTIVRVHNIGTYKGQEVERCNTKIMLKRFNDPLNMSLLLTCISPWFFRYWVFLFWTATFKTHLGLGNVTVPYEASTKDRIFINSEECTSKTEYEKKVKELKKLNLDV